jgi:hypothetical protein
VSRSVQVQVTFPNWKEAALFMDEMQERFRFDTEVRLEDSNPYRLFAEPCQGECV